MKMRNLKYLMAFLLLAIGIVKTSAQQGVLTKVFNGEKCKAGDAIIKQSKRYAKNGLGCTSFEVDVPSSGYYYVNFWMIPTQEPTGEPTTYTIEINDKTVTDKIIPEKCDWQSIGTSNGKPFYLNAGTNTIAVLGKLPFFPEIETIRLSSNLEKATFSSEEYDIFRDNALSSTTQQSTTSSTSSRSSNFPIYGIWQLGAQISYTFTTTLFLNSGTLYTISSSSNSSYPHYLEIFSEPNQNYSNRTLSNNGQATIQNIQSSSGGIYVLRVRSSHHGATSTASVSINGGSQYVNVPISNYEISYSQPTDKEYNSFLCHRSGSGDPYLDIMSYSSNKIYLARNDNGSSYGGDYSWGTCPRIKAQLSTSSDAALVFNNSSLYPYCTADIYLGFPNFSDINASILDSFPSYKEGDAIASAPASTPSYSYNCAAWAVGIWDHNRWPPGESVYNYPEFANCYTDLERFDVFFGQYGYTRSGATESNSIIDLWKKGYEYKHVSVRKYNNSDNIPHGYAWESKFGSQPRAFHPRYALKDTIYGNVTDHYRWNTTSKMGQSLFENVADGNIVIENVTYNKDEISLINKCISCIPIEKTSELLRRYSKWTDVISRSPYSNISSMKECEEYQALYDYCNNNMEIRYILFKLLGEDEEMVSYLVEDLLYKQNQHVLEKLKEENQKNTMIGNAIIYRKPITCVMKFVKLLLNSDNSPSFPASRGISSDLSYSNKNAFNLTKKDCNIDVSFSLKEDSRISLMVYTLNGVIVDNLLNNKQLHCGSYKYSITFKNSGTYLVVYKENGTTSVKKVIIN